MCRRAIAKTWGLSPKPTWWWRCVQLWSGLFSFIESLFGMHLLSNVTVDFITTKTVCKNLATFCEHTTIKGGGSIAKVQSKPSMEDGLHKVLWKIVLRLSIRLVLYGNYQLSGCPSYALLNKIKFLDEIKKNGHVDSLNMDFWIWISVQGFRAVCTLFSSLFGT